MKTIALFGGSFDPPHIGHEAIVKALLDCEYIDKVIIMPTFLNPFKSKSHAPSELRLKWLKKIFSEYKDVYVDSYEVDQNKKVSTIQSVKHLLKEYKKIYVVIGADNLSSLNRWNSYDELKDLVTFIVITRGDIVIDDKFIKLDVDVDTSSTKLRDAIKISKIPKKCAKEIIEYYKENNEKQN